MRKCKQCGAEKVLNEFYFRKDSNTYRLKCKECIKENRKEFRKTDYYKDYERKYRPEYMKRPNKVEARRLSERKWYRRNKEAEKARKAIMYQRIKHTGIWNVYASNRRARKLKADLGFDCSFIYAECAALNTNPVVKYHVDHIIPLKGDKVSGLHVPWNLQILTSEDNLIKSNKFDGTYENKSWVDDTFL